MVDTATVVSVPKRSWAVRPGHPVPQMSVPETVMCQALSVWVKVMGVPGGTRASGWPL